MPFPSVLQGSLLRDLSFSWLFPYFHRKLLKKVKGLFIAPVSRGFWFLKGSLYFWTLFLCGQVPTVVAFCSWCFSRASERDAIKGRSSQPLIVVDRRLIKGGSRSLESKQAFMSLPERFRVSWLKPCSSLDFEN